MSFRDNFHVFNPSTILPSPFSFLHSINPSKQTETGGRTPEVVAAAVSTWRNDGRTPSPFPSFSVAANVTLQIAVPLAINQLTERVIDSEGRGERGEWRGERGEWRGESGDVDGKRQRV